MGVRTPVSPSVTETTSGRPRDPRVDAAVLAAARELVLEGGYGAASIEAISRRAGVSRPAIYRRWRTKAEVVFEAVYPGDDVIAVADTGDVRADLATCVRRTIDLFTRPEVQAAIPGLLADVQADPDLPATLTPLREDPARAAFAAMIERAQKRGEVRADVDADTLFDAVAGPVLFRVLNGPPLSRRARTSFERGLVDLLVHATAPAPSRSGGTP